MCYFECLKKLIDIPFFGYLFKSMFGSLLPMNILMTANDGQVTIATVDQPARTWTLNTEADEIDTTNASDAANQSSFLPGRIKSSFTAEIYADDLLAETIVGAEAGLAIILVAKQGTTDKSWAFTAVILSSQIVANIPGGDAVLISISGRITGAITQLQFT